MKNLKHIRHPASLAGTGTCGTAEHPGNLPHEKTPSREHRPVSGAAGHRPLWPDHLAGFRQESAVVPAGTPGKPERPCDKPHASAPARLSGQNGKKPRPDNRTGAPRRNGSAPAAPADTSEKTGLPRLARPADTGQKNPATRLPAPSWNPPMDTPIEQKIFPTVHAVLKTACGESDRQTAAFIGAVAMELFAILLADTGNRPDIIDSFIETAEKRAT